MAYKEILRLAPMGASLAVAGRSFDMARRPHKEIKDYMGGTVDILVGTHMSKEIANLVEL